MAGSVNLVILVGNVGRDPETRTFGNGGKLTSFSLATSESWQDRASGERRERTEWHNIVVRNEKLAEIATRFLRKGSKVYVQGVIQSRKYTDQSGAERSVTEIVVGPFDGVITMLSPRESGTQQGQERGASPLREYAAQSSAASPKPSWAAPPKPEDDLDDEIPF